MCALCSRKSKFLVKYLDDMVLLYRWPFLVIFFVTFGILNYVLSLRRLSLDSWTSCIWLAIVYRIYLHTGKKICSLDFGRSLTEMHSFFIYYFLMSNWNAFLLPVLSPQKVSTEEHVLPLWLNPWSSQSFRHLYKRIHLGVKVSSLSDADM